MTEYVQLALGSLIGSLIFVGIVGRQMIRMRRMTHELEHYTALAQDSVHLAEWARHTMVTVTRATGDIEALSLEEMASVAQDYVWTDPICVSVWTGTPGTISRFREDLKGENHG